MDFAIQGSRYGSDKAHGEVAYCAPLLHQYGPQLLDQGIEPAHQVRLEALDAQLTRDDQALALAQKEYEKTTDAVAVLMSAAVSLVGKAWSFALKAFGEAAPETLESFPARGSMSVSIDGTVRCLNDAAGFVTTHQPALEAAGAPATLGLELSRQAEEIIAANRVQSAAAQRVSTQSQAVKVVRGQIYNLCRLVYNAGRTGFRRQESIRSLFRFEHMRRASSSAKSESDATSATGSDTNAGSSTGTTASSSASAGG